MELSRRTSSFQESVIREMTRLGDETGSVNLSQGLPEIEPPQEILMSAIEAIRNGENQYTFPFGSFSFRHAIAEKYLRDNAMTVDPETEVTATCGVSEAIASTIFALTEPGDEVIIIEPWYENYIPDCIMAGVKPVFVPLLEPGYEIDFERLNDSITSKTRLLLLNNPHNPTGKVFSESELIKIADLCISHEIIAVTDEIYEYIYYDGFQPVSLGSLPGMADRTVTISGLGKTFSLTGWRVGWSVAQANISRLIRKVHDYLTVCAPAPFQAAGVTALNLPASYYDELRQKYAACRAVFTEPLRRAGFQFMEPSGAYYIMANYSSIDWDKPGGNESGIKTSSRLFAEFMATKIGVAVVPGSSFYYENKGEISTVRFNFAKKPETLEEAVKRISKIRRL